ncbi:hypothetical protein [Micromonospora parathelypteridis]|uniref:Uncharacterized protein n=1 Tax=Micromonospora parathelypteridis TaxID=1839617 RepID=A0A840VQJ5_9ACTN|nr:hypothetical protein [Micromonospora parathelypteridis]MBB5478975.1 hypothetical protein [Micromonospora parathelypteridis]GGO03664.1 hypothetical protein GCM10011576_04280 [Micromonospora parathelypteridis]
MTTDPLRATPVSATVEVVEPRPSLDYYLVLAPHGDHEPAADPEGIVVEEFTHHHDHSTTGLDSAGWTPASGWWSSASVSLSMRTDPDVLARVVPTRRREAESVYRALGGGHLPDETTLRTYFRDHQPIATAPPLRLGPAQPPAGFHERRVYRVLFAKDLLAEQVAGLRAAWQTPKDGAGASVASGRLDRDGDRFTWDLRRVGHTLAWCLDVTVLLRTAATGAVGPTLSDLTDVLREHGLIPVTTERFS